MQSDKIKVMMMIIKHQDMINQVQLMKRNDDDEQSPDLGVTRNGRPPKTPKALSIVNRIRKYEDPYSYRKSALILNAPRNPPKTQLPLLQGSRHRKRLHVRHRDECFPLHFPREVYKKDERNNASQKKVMMKVIEQDTSGEEKGQSAVPSRCY